MLHSDCFGKTRAAFEDGAIFVTYDNGFFSDWMDAKTIVLDEMNGSIPYKTLLQFTDGYRGARFANIKGGHKLINVDKIYITSSAHPRDIYPRQNLKDGSITQLLRRCKKIIHYTNKGKFDVTDDKFNTYDDIFE